MNFIKNWAGLIALVVLAISAVFGSSVAPSFGASGTRFPNGLSTIAASSPAAGELLTSILQVGSNGTDLAGIKTGSCTIWASSQTIAATSSAQVECQSATNGTLASGLTGITADSICSLNNASSTNTTSGSIVVAGVSASSTPGSIVARIANLTGGTFTWDATASSSAKWTYSCFDPS